MLEDFLSGQFSRDDLLLAIRARPPQSDEQFEADLMLLSSVELDEDDRAAFQAGLESAREAARRQGAGQTQLEISAISIEQMANPDFVFDDEAPPADEAPEEAAPAAPVEASPPPVSQPEPAPEPTPPPEPAPKPAPAPPPKPAAPPPAEASQPRKRGDETTDSTWGQVAKLDAPSSPVTVGSLLKDRFLLEKEIGRGGMGVVYQALDKLKEEAQERNPRVAVKVLNDEFRQHKDALKALQREARKSQQLNHDNIVRVYDFDRDGASIFMTMELIDGHPLTQLVRDEDFAGLSLEQAAPIIEGMGAALARAHDAGFVHSDFKPGNVLLGRDGVPKVFDFGIARAAAHTETAEVTVFDPGSLGALTPAYASLEMLDEGEPDPRDDIYALALVIYELLTGEHAYQRKAAAIALRENLKPQRVEGLNRWQWRALEQGLAIKREDRIGSVQELIDGLLGRVKTGGGSRWPLWIAAATAGLVVLGAALFGISQYVERHEAQAFVTALESGTFNDAGSLRVAFDALDAPLRRRLAEEHQGLLTDTITNLARRSWSPADGRYDYDGAVAAYETLGYLVPESLSAVMMKTRNLSDERKLLLEQLEKRLANAPPGEPRQRILDRIRQVYPGSPLLSD